MVSGGRVLTGQEALGSEYQVSDIVVLPYSSRLVVGPDNEFRTGLSIPSEIAVHGSAVVQKHHPDSYVIIPGETTYKGLPDTTTLMEEALGAYGVTKTVPLHRLRGGSGRALDNTYLQMRGAADYLSAADSPQVLVMPFKPHLERVMKISRALGIQANFVTVENVLSEAGISEYDDYLQCIADLRRGERFKRFFSFKQGLLPNLITSVAGPSYLDVVETESGYILEQGLARTRQKELQRSLNATETKPAY